MTQQLSIFPLPSYHITIQFSYSPLPSAGNHNYSFPNSSDNVFISHPAKHKNPAVKTCLFQESSCIISAGWELQNSCTRQSSVYVAMDYLKDRRDLLLGFISFLWVSLYISRKLLLSTHQELLHSCGMSRYHPTLADKWTARPWVMCSAVLSIFTGNCLLKKADGPHCLKYDHFLSSGRKMCCKISQ